MMKISHVVPFGDISATTLNASWAVANRNEGDGLRFKQSFQIELPTGGSAEELLLDTTTALHLESHSLTFNALDDNAPEQVQIKKFGATGLLATLAVPRLIKSIAFANSLSPEGKSTQLFRTDGDVVSEEPVASFINPTKTKDSFSLSVNKDKLEVTDNRILVQLKGDNFVPLQNESITEFNLTTNPENLRIGLRIPALNTELFYLPLQIESGKAVNASSELHKQLSSLFKRLQEFLDSENTNPGPANVLPDPLELDIVIESDAPCNVTISQFAICYKLVRHSFPNGEAKQVLRFAKDQLEQQQVAFEIPSSVNISEAILKLAGDGAEFSSADTTAASSGLLNQQILATEENALRLDADHRWASPLKLDAAILSGGVILLISTITPATSLYLEIVTDNNGSPGREPLACAESQLSAQAHPQLLNFTLESALLLQPGNYWLKLESREGTAIWDLHEQQDSYVFPWHDINDNSTNNTGLRDIIEGLAGVANWIASAGSAALAQRFPEITLAGQPLSLSVNENDWDYDITPVLATLTSTGSILTTIELSVIASGPKPVTVHAPRIEYEL